MTTKIAVSTRIEKELRMLLLSENITIASALEFGANAMLNLCNTVEDLEKQKKDMEQKHAIKIKAINKKIEQIGAKNKKRILNEYQLGIFAECAKDWEKNPEKFEGIFLRFKNLSLIFDMDKKEFLALLEEGRA